MNLSVREAATLLGQTRRTIRAKLVRGELPGRKVGGKWQIRRRDIPLTESQRLMLQRKAEAVRDAVDSVLPSRLASRSDARQRSLGDLNAFRMGVELLSALRQFADLPSDRLRRAGQLLEDSLLALAEGIGQFDRRLKLAALNQARGGFSRATALLLIEAKERGGQQPYFEWVNVLELNIVPSVAGLARWVDRLERSR